MDGEGTQDYMLKYISPVVANEATYQFQWHLKAIGVDIGAFEDMKTGQPTGADGKFGPTIDRVVKALQTEWGLSVTGIVDALFYAKLAEKRAANQAGNRCHKSAAVRSIEQGRRSD